jgi:hypothetical protein
MGDWLTGWTGLQCYRDCFVALTIPSLQMPLCPLLLGMAMIFKGEGEGLAGLHDEVGEGEVVFGQGFLGEGEIEHADITPRHGEIIVGVDL